MSEHKFGVNEVDVQAQFAAMDCALAALPRAKRAAQASLSRAGQYRNTQSENVVSLMYLGKNKQTATVLAKAASKEFGVRRYVSPFEVGQWLLKAMPELAPREHVALARDMAGDAAIQISLSGVGNS